MSRKDDIFKSQIHVPNSRPESNSHIPITNHRSLITNSFMLSDAHCHFFTEGFLAALSWQRGRAESIEDLVRELGWEPPRGAEQLAREEAARNIERGDQGMTPVCA